MDREDPGVSVVAILIGSLDAIVIDRVHPLREIAVKAAGKSGLVAFFPVRDDGDRGGFSDIPERKPVALVADALIEVARMQVDMGVAREAEGGVEWVAALQGAIAGADDKRIAVAADRESSRIEEVDLDAIFGGGDIESVGASGVKFGVRSEKVADFVNGQYFAHV